MGGGTQGGGGAKDPSDESKLPNAKILMRLATFIGAVQLFFLGILGEYILSINTRTMHRPLVVVGEKINFEAGTGENEEKREASDE